MIDRGGHAPSGAAPVAADPRLTYAPPVTVEGSLRVVALRRALVLAVLLLCACTIGRDDDAATEPAEPARSGSTGSPATRVLPPVDADRDDAPSSLDSGLATGAGIDAGMGSAPGMPDGAVDAVPDAGEPAVDDPGRPGPTEECAEVHVLATRSPSDSCRFELNVVVHADSACQGRVTLDGTALACDDDHGYLLLSPSTIALVGAPCELLRSSAAAVVDVTFPCGTVDVL